MSNLFLKTLENLSKRQVDTPCGLCYNGDNGIIKSMKLGFRRRKK